MRAFLIVTAVLPLFVRLAEAEFCWDFEPPWLDLNQLTPPADYVQVVTSPKEEQQILGRRVAPKLVADLNNGPRHLFIYFNFSS